MKTRRWMLILLASFGLAFVPDAQAFYNPITGRWLSRDPLGESGFESRRLERPNIIGDGGNLYSFVHNDSIDKTDDLGLLTSIDNMINTCMAMPTPAQKLECLKDICQIFDCDKAAKKALQDALDKVKRIASCEAIYAAYKAAGNLGAGCQPGLTCAEYKKKVAAIEAEVAGRAAWLGKRCDYVCSGSVLSKEGSKKKEVTHGIELANKSAYLAKCAALKKAACGE